MKYQQLENLEAGWKWKYLNEKALHNESITRWIDSSEIEVALEQLTAMEAEPIKVNDWISTHISPEYDRKLNQAIRAKRKRYFNGEQKHTSKKSIDLDFEVWKKLSTLSNDLGTTLSDCIEILITDRQQQVERD